MLAGANTDFHWLPPDCTPYKFSLHKFFSNFKFLRLCIFLAKIDQTFWHKFINFKNNRRLTWEDSRQFLCWFVRLFLDPKVFEQIDQIQFPSFLGFDHFVHCKDSGTQGQMSLKTFSYYFVFLIDKIVIPLFVKPYFLPYFL